MARMRSTISCRLIEGGRRSLAAYFKALPTGSSSWTISFCGTYPMSPLRSSESPLTRSDPNRISPLLGVSCPRSARTKVVFPAPLGPSTQTNSPGFTESEISLSNSGPELPAETASPSTLRERFPRRGGAEASGEVDVMAIDLRRRRGVMRGRGVSSNGNIFLPRRILPHGERSRRLGHQRAIDPCKDSAKDLRASPRLRRA